MPPPAPGDDALAHYNRLLIDQIDEEIARDLPTKPSVQKFLEERSFFDDQISARRKKRRAAAGPTPGKPVGILGAGACGLYTAMILQDLSIPYRLIEAKGEVGGRLFTYNFPNSLGEPYNYFDIGAMRFPNITAMHRIFNLFENPNLNTPDINLAGRLRPFYFDGQGNDKPFLYYNDVRKRISGAPIGDTFKASKVLQNPDKQAYINAGYAAIVDDVIRPYASALLDDLNHNTRTGYEKLLSIDDYSTRAYLTFNYTPSNEVNIPKKHLTTDIVDWLETFDKSTGWYDRAFTETVLEAVTFGFSPNGTKVDWHLIDGGSQKIADAMAAYIKKQSSDAILFNERVLSIKVADPETVTVTTSHDQHNFAHVISSLPLPVMRTVDLNGAKLSPMQSNAIRDLDYSDSLKIGMQFRTAWWTTGKDRNGKTLGIIGGQTYTDTPLRTVVYPSFGDVFGAKTTTLIASYCWTEDARRLGALIDQDDQFLAQMVLKELSDIHNVDIEFLTNELIDIKGWSWSHDPYTMGAYAFFGPGKYKFAYTSLNAPAAGNLLHFAGEAISARHAWVEGALDSAWRAVAEMLTGPEFTDEQRQKFQTNWGKNPEWIPADVLARYSLDDIDIFSGNSSLIRHLAYMEAYNAAA